MALDPLVAVPGHIPLSEHHLAGLGRLARASALLLMYRGVYQTTEFDASREWLERRNLSLPVDGWRDRPETGTILVPLDCA